jgi:hypothetical protein
MCNVNLHGDIYCQISSVLVLGIYRKVLKMLHVQQLWCLFLSNNWRAVTQFKVLIVQLNSDGDKLVRNVGALEDADWP